jgi:hypothetical protein
MYVYYVCVCVCVCVYYYRRWTVRRWMHGCSRR